MQKSVRYNEGHALYLALLARKEGTRRGYLSKKTAETSRWHDKWFAMYQNMLFYFESEQSTRPAGMYMLEGCSCERALAPKGASAVSVKDSALDKQASCQVQIMFCFLMSLLAYSSYYWLKKNGLLILLNCLITLTLQRDMRECIQCICPSKFKAIQVILVIEQQLSPKVMLLSEKLVTFCSILQLILPYLLSESGFPIDFTCQKAAKDDHMSPGDCNHHKYESVVKPPNENHLTVEMLHWS